MSTTVMRIVVAVMFGKGMRQLQKRKLYHACSWTLVDLARKDTNRSRGLKFKFKIQRSYTKWLDPNKRGNKLRAVTRAKDISKKAFINKE